MLDGTTTDAARPSGLFRTSLLARAAWVGVVVVAVGLAPLWPAIAWAVAVP